jgi:16S rRNA (cytosine1402-N4)-methyltransferase
MQIDEVMTMVQSSPEFGHVPVMVKEILEAFEPLRSRENLRYFDGTFGRGGHFRAVNALFDGKITSMVMDQDEEAIVHAMESFQPLVQDGRLHVVHGNFSQFSEHPAEPFDMMLLDLGVSSPQLDTKERGFSFYHDGPLDMRMNQSQHMTAEILLNTATEAELTTMFQELGEIRQPFRVVRAIAHDRRTKAFKTTRELASLIERVDGWRVKGQHPATRYFMALRLSVNNELGVLEHTLPQLMSALKDGGRLAVLSFHSLEDRIVKTVFRDSPVEGFQIHKKVIVPTQEECKSNGRSRSAKLRVFQRGVQDELGESAAF